MSKGQTRSKTVTVTFREDEHDVVKEVAKEDGRPMSSFIHRIVMGDPHIKQRMSKPQKSKKGGR